MGILNPPLRSKCTLAKECLVRMPIVGGAECCDFCLLHMSQLKSFGTGIGGESLYTARIMLRCPRDSCFSLYVEPYETDNTYSCAASTFHNPSSFRAIMNSFLSFSYLIFSFPTVISTPTSSSLLLKT